MSTDSPPGSPRPAAGGEFTWPPTCEELDAIEVIPLHESSSVKPIAVVPMTARRGRLRLPRRLPRREDLAFTGVLCTSVLAIAVAATMQFSDLWHPEPAPEVPPVAELIAATPTLAATSPIMMSPIATAPVAMRPVSTATTPVQARHVERRRVSTPRSQLAKHTARPAYTARPTRVNDAPVNFARPRLISPESGRDGKLVLLVQVRKNGKVGDVDVLSSNLDRDNRSHRDLQRAAVSTVKRWRYAPAMRDGQPTDTQIRVVVDINLASARTAFTEANARRRVAAANRAADTYLAAR